MFKKLSVLCVVVSIAALLGAVSSADAASLVREDHRSDHEPQTIGASHMTKGTPGDRDRDVVRGKCLPECAFAQ